MISLEQYWKGRDVEYADELTEEIKANAAETVAKVNLALEAAEADTGYTFNEVASGWRPAAVNDATANAAAHSKHLTAQACDVRDPLGQLDAWCVANQETLKEIGLWIESPSKTPNWAHFQTIPPHSGSRVFIP